MARLLLGVSGGIAAYKALETVRLAIRAGHAVRVIQTPTSERFVGRASFEGITGAPVLVSEFEPDPARGSYPGEPLPDRAPISHLALVERAEVFLIAPATPTRGQASPRPGRQSADHGGAGRAMPGRGRAGHEQPHVSERRYPGEHRAGSAIWA